MLVLVFIGNVLFVTFLYLISPHFVQHVLVIFPDSFLSLEDGFICMFFNVLHMMGIDQ